MPQTIEAIYHDGIIELKERPSGIKKARVLVTFPDVEEKYSVHTIDLNKVKKKKSTIDKWIGLLEGIDLGDWKTSRRKYLEEKHN
jgi:predicted DNA-binding antitoxin AbrB/MazE fold protein